MFFHFGLAVVALLVHHVDLGVKLLAQILRRRSEGSRPRVSSRSSCRLQPYLKLLQGQSRHLQRGDLLPEVAHLLLFPLLLLLLQVLASLGQEELLIGGKSPGETVSEQLYLDSLGCFLSNTPSINRLKLLSHLEGKLTRSRNLRLWLWKENTET